MLHVILPNLQLILFFVCLIVESYKKILIRHFAIDSIVIYRITIISNIQNKVVNCIEFRVIEDWLI